jgi:hypothetical protein
MASLPGDVVGSRPWPGDDGEQVLLFGAGLLTNAPLVRLVNASDQPAGVPVVIVTDVAMCFGWWNNMW